MNRNEVMKPEIDMTQNQAPDAVRRLMTAASQLLVGEGGDIENPAFGRNLILIVGGDIGPTGALRLAAFARANHRNVAHLAFGNSDNPETPIVTFAHYAGGDVDVYETCILWAADDRSPVHIIRPDAGVAFQMSRGQRVKRRRTAVSNRNEAVEGGRRALQRLYALADALPEAALLNPQKATAS